MNIMITGCAGFIGSHAVEEFLSSGYNVIGVDNLTYAGKEENMSSFIDDIKFYFCDICETDRLSKIVKVNNVEWIINFAAETHVDNSILSSRAFIHSNIQGVASLLDICNKLDVKLFHISTDEVYGSIRYGSFSETDPLDPKNPYSATKAAAELLINSYSNTHDIKYLMVRPSNNFGPRQDYEKFIPTIINRLKNKRKVPVYGDGKNIRDWLYVKDNVAAIRYILENSSLNEVYNITSSYEKSNISIVSNICDILGKNIDDSVEYVSDRPGHDFRYSIYNTKLRNLGFFENHVFNTFEVNLNHTINYYDGFYYEKS